MLVAHGWAILRSSREGYTDAAPEQLFALDEQSDIEDSLLLEQFRLWMRGNADDFMVWSLTEQLNNHQGLLQFSVSRNHRSSGLWEMLEFLANSSEGNYGLVYVHDSEDNKSNKNYGRGTVDYGNVYRVWRILKGKLNEFDDPFLSPIVPCILPNFEA